MREAVEQYLRSVRDIHRSGGGVRETSYYGALEALFNSVGHGLTPRVRCILHVRNVGAGIPDGGFFTADQLQRVADDRQAMVDVGVPARGVIEVKGAGDELTVTANGEQVGRYLETYGQVLVTNLRGFLMVGPGEDGERRFGERFDLVDGGEHLFWQAIEDPGEVWGAKGGQFAEYLTRALLMRAPLTEPKFLASFLASYARDAAARLERGGTPGLTALRSALEQALGLRFQGEKGDHFFRSTLVQTLFYGVFSAWVLWSKEQKPGSPGSRERFDWKDTGHLLHVPAMLHAPGFHRENAGALRMDWPRAPLPGAADGLRRSAGLGRRLAALLDPERAVPGVTDGRLAAEMRDLAAVTVVEGASLELRLTAGWGHGGGGRPVMPSRGRAVRRTFTGDERAALAGRVNPLGLDAGELAAPLGEETLDVFLNGQVYWRNVPAGVWEYTLGGYQVLKKWLSYREATVLGRGLEPEEAREFSRIARRIAAILLLGPELDANYQAVVRDAYAWPTASTGPQTLRMW